MAKKGKRTHLGRPDTIGHAGAQLGFFILEKLLGKPGEQGEVWLAHASSSDAIKFAVKISKKALSRRDTSYQEFTREFQILAPLSHSNIVHVFAQDIYEKGSIHHPYYVMEYLGESVKPLHDAIEDSKVSVDQKLLLCLRAFFDTAAALKHFHKNKGTHGDIKAPNILVQNYEQQDCSIRLIDFGFAWVLPDNEAASPTKVDAKMAAARQQGRLPQGRSSHHHPSKTKSPQHTDLWQLAFTIKSLLMHPALDPEHLFADAEGLPLVQSTKGWPIDIADFPRLRTLLADWANVDRGGKPEMAPLDTFYEDVMRLHRTWNYDHLPDHLRGAIQYLAVPEIATSLRISVSHEAMRLPPQQLVLYTDRIKHLITHAPYGDLRYTRQLGFAHLAYPGAEGTRFEHSLGVYNLACRFVAAMASQTTFRKLSNSPKVTIKFLIAALLHDIGHFPFAHQIEEFRRGRSENTKFSAPLGIMLGHHSRGATLIRQSFLPILARYFELTSTDAEDIILLMHRGNFGEFSHDCDAFEFLATVLDGPIDIDKLDYVERDAYHCGVPYGSYLDVDRIIETMRVIELSGRVRLAFDHRGVGCLEQLVTARHQMYANVYWHRAVRSATCMFKHAFWLLCNVNAKTARVVEQQFLEARSDDELLFRLMQTCREIRTSGVSRLQMVRAASHLLNSIAGGDRILYKSVLELEGSESNRRDYGSLQYESQRGVAGEIYAALQRMNALTDAAEALGEHNVLVDCLSDKAIDFDQVCIIANDGRPRRLQDYLPYIPQLRDTFDKQACRIRVFINPLILKPEFNDKKKRSQLGQLIKMDLETISGHASERAQPRLH